MQSKRTISGFTLLELVIVLALISILVMIAAPTLASFGRGRGTDEAATRFVALAHWARTQSISDGVTYQLNIDASGGRWWLTKDGGNSFIAVESPYGNVCTVPEGVQLSSNIPVVNNSQIIVFDPSGRCDVATVHFTGPGTNDIEVASETPSDVFHVISQAGGH